MKAQWREASVELVPGYQVTGPDGLPTSTVAHALVTFEGGFVHLDIPGTAAIQTVSAPAVRLITTPRPTPSQP
ncbi:hypothetical protein [Streptacidiphilus sp. EB129]|uniref:hypothetical protein n=1 Tax=Streptacidiphilus sp. EB129 TaxID=3156262 RepID=UPI0035191F02